MKKLSPSLTVWIFVFCAATAIVSSAQTFATLVNFNSTNGSAPTAQLVQATDGNFYGTTLSGGAGSYCSLDCGTIFRITPTGSLATVYNFCSQPNCADGGVPWAGVVQGTDGNFYGTTSGGGANSNILCAFGCGTVFKITPGGTLTTLYNFCSQSGCTDGATTYSGLVQGSDGNFYGTTTHGGNASGYCDSGSCGTVFKITPGGLLTTLYSFCSQPPCMDGANPYVGLVQGTDGNFYGTAEFGGDYYCASGCGTVFKISPGGALTTIYTFCTRHNGCPDGRNPGALIQATDGSFYGPGQGGGPHEDGMIFKITSTGTLTTVYTFKGTDGAGPGPLIQATDGNFYGTTGYGGNFSDCNRSGCGTVFSLTPNGTLTTLHSFDGTDGQSPTGLVQATNGSFYGVTEFGGTSQNCPGIPGGCGTVFSLNVGIVLSPVQFVPVTPCRLYDTRMQYGGNGPIQGGTFQFFNLPQLAKQGQGCPDLSAAAAYSLNVTVVPQGPLGYLTIWPAERPQPLVSTLNSYDGRVKAVAAIVPGGASEAVSVFVTDTTDVILDIDGYFTTPSQQTLQFYPLPPCRVADTRDSSFPPQLGPPFLTGGVPRDFPILAATSCNIPNSAQAYSLNLTAVPHGSLGFLSIWPKDQMPQNLVSTLNSYGGQYTANAAIVPAGTNGEVTAYASPGSDTDLVIDINGYFAPGGQGGLSLYPVVPCRVIDTRPPSGNGPFLGTLSPPVDVVNSPCAVPSTAQAYVLNATVVPTGALGYLTLWPDGGSMPLVSTLNALDGIVTSNMAIVPAGNQGKIDAYADQNTAPTDLILDISSYFAP